MLKELWLGIMLLINTAARLYKYVCVCMCVCVLAYMVTTEDLHMNTHLLIEDRVLSEVVLGSTEDDLS